MTWLHSVWTPHSLFNSLSSAFHPTSSLKLSGKGHEWVLNSQPLAHFSSHSSLSSVAHGTINPRQPWQALLLWGLGPYSLFTLTGLLQGPTPKCWVSLPRMLSFTSVSRYCPHNLCCQLKSPTPVHAGGPSCRPVCLIDFWMVPARISQVPQVQFLLNWIQPHLCQT